MEKSLQNVVNKRLKCENVAKWRAFWNERKQVKNFVSEYKIAIVPKNDRIFWKRQKKKKTVHRKCSNSSDPYKR